MNRPQFSDGSLTNPPCSRGPFPGSSRIKLRWGRRRWHGYLSIDSQKAAAARICWAKEFLSRSSMCTQNGWNRTCSTPSLGGRQRSMAGFFPKWKEKKPDRFFSKAATNQLVPVRGFRSPRQKFHNCSKQKQAWDR